MAVPLFELHDSAAKFGSVISGVPVMLSRLRYAGSAVGFSWVGRSFTPALPSGAGQGLSREARLLCCGGMGEMNILRGQFA